jgi:hypothetical protein
MRVSSLSDARVISLITKYFVPVWHSRDAYQLEPPAQEEWAEALRIDRDRGKRGLPGGTVCVYLLSPDGSVAATQPVQEACKAENLVPFLEKLIAKEKLRPRDPEAVRATKAGTRAARPKAGNGNLVVHLWTRMAESGSNRGTSQDWVEWTAAEWKTLLPAEGAKAGKSWKVPRSVADKLCARCYPPGPYWSAKQSKVIGAELTATAVRTAPEEIRVKLQGNLEVVHPAEGKETDRRVKARVLGFLRYDPARQAVTSLVLTSEQAESVWYWQGQPQRQKLLIGAENAE